MRKTILCLSLLSLTLTFVIAPTALCQSITDGPTTAEQPDATAVEELKPQSNAPALRPVIEPTAPTVETTSNASEPSQSEPKPLYKRALSGCVALSKKMANGTRNTCAHPVVAVKQLPENTGKALLATNKKVLEISEKPLVARNIELIGKLTTLFGAYFFAKNSFNNFGKSTNKTVIVGQ